MAKGKYKPKDPRPVYVDERQTYDYIIIAQETESSYLIIPVVKFLNRESISLGKQSWFRKEHFNLSKEKIGEVRLTPWTDKLENPDELKILIDSYENALTGKLFEDAVEVEIKKDNKCSNCGFKENQIRDDGLIKCTQCGIYYIGVDK